MNNLDSKNKLIDVVILGGVLAGMSLALQLKKTDERISVTVIEKNSGSAPIATHKVGESTVEIGGHYFANVLGLKDHLEKDHLPKLGLRYFYGNGNSSIDERPELGSSMFSPVPTYQLDRGILENHLRELAIQVGVNVLTSALVKETELNSGDTPNTVLLESEGEVITLNAKWVIDATGRRRLIQRHLGLSESSGHNASAVWFRVKGCLSVDQLGKEINSYWLDRNLEDRFLSTNHLMGKGYWVWLIPLSSGNTSIGIVTQDDLHDYRAYSRDKETVMEWLHANETELAAELSNYEFLDFKKIKEFSYSSKQLFSIDRWACVGEAGIFSDPFYSPGSDIIAVTNSLAHELVFKDLAADLQADDVDNSNQFVLYQLFPDQISYYKNMYHVFGDTTVSAAKFFWDTIYYWNVYAEKFLSGTLLDLSKLKSTSSGLEKFSLLNFEAQALFYKWARHDSPRSWTFDFIDLATKHEFIRNVLNLVTESSSEKDAIAYDQLKEMLTQLKMAHANEMNSKPDVKTKDSVSEVGVFSGLFNNQSNGSERKQRFASRLVGMRKGRFLYYARSFYINAFVKGKKKPKYFELLERSFPA